MIAAPAATEIRALTVKELPLCVEHARAFHAEKQLPGGFVPEVFIKNWTAFLTTYPAVILAAWHEGEPVGAFGALVSPDLLDGRLTATEMFWYLAPEHRHGLLAFKLIDAFEAWGHEQGAVEFRMLHMLLPGEDPSTVRLGPIYRRRHYRPIEVGYCKPNPKRS